MTLWQQVRMAETEKRKMRCVGQTPVWRNCTAWRVCMASRSIGPNQLSSRSVGTRLCKARLLRIAITRGLRGVRSSGSKQTCGSAATSPVCGGLNVGFQPRGINGSRLQRMTASRPILRVNPTDSAHAPLRSGPPLQPDAPLFAVLTHQHGGLGSCRR